jgi:polysaccharide biosynthesis/export protein
MRFHRPMFTNRQCRFVLLPLLLVTFCAAGFAAQESPAATAATDKALESTDKPVNAPSEGSAKPSTALQAPRNSDLRLGGGDLVELSVYNVPELSTKTRVGSNGDIYLPLIDYVHVGGLSLEEAQSLIEKRYSDGGYLKDPHVTVFVDEYASQGASLLGEVAKPGVYPVLGQQRLLDLISSAGGFSDKAGRVVTITHRDQPDKPTTVTLARNPAENTESNVQVYPGDTITVHRADIVYVVGEVGKPSGFLMDSGSLTVLQAIALAGGVTHTAKLDGAKIIRKTPQGMAETTVQLKKILAAKSPDVPMQADDILFVPTSAGKIAAGRTIEAAVQAATAISIIAIRP